MMMTYQIAYSCNHLLRIAQCCQQLLRCRRFLLLLQLTAALTEFLLSRLDSNIMYNCRRLQYKLLPGRKLLLFPIILANVYTFIKCWIRLGSPA